MHHPPYTLNFYSGPRAHGPVLISANNKMSDNYLTKQIITYMGNKRKFVPMLESVVTEVEAVMGRKLVLGDGFAGSGVVSRLFKKRGAKLYTNDISSYSKTLAQCYLSTPSKRTLDEIGQHILRANAFASADDAGSVERWIQQHWAPHGEIKLGDRVYFTRENAARIDRYRHYIASLPEEARCYLLAPLLVECSVHNNTSGQFSAFYKDGQLGKLGGKKGIDLKRITKKIELQMPLFSSNECEVSISRSDTNAWARTLPRVDLMYYDPPYNKHPYSIYYFLLDIINDWNTNAVIPDTTRGQPKNWIRSPYNSFTNAATAMEDLIKNTKANFIVLSYNSGGIVPLDELEAILVRYGKLTKIPVSHKTYNKLKGIANYKRQKEQQELKEFLWFLDCRAV